MVSSRDKGVETQDYMINWNVGPLGLVLRPDLGADMPPVVSQVLPGESVASLAGVAVGDMLVSVNGKKASKLGYEKAMKLLYKQKLPMILHFRIPQFKTVVANTSMDSPSYYNQQQQSRTPTSGGTGLIMTPSSTRHASSAGNSNPYQSASYPGQFVQYNQQQHHQQYQQFQPFQQHQQHQQSPHFQDQQPQFQLSQSFSQRQANHNSSMIGSSRAVRSHSVLSTSTMTKEQKLRKQFSAVWESGSLGFSFRPYAPGVNIPTVDLIGARGEGKNMDQVCVNDVLIAINGENTKNLGVERVLKMLHVLEKPVVLRFHKSSQRIENLQATTRARRRSNSAKLPAVVERDQEQETGDDDDEGEGGDVTDEEAMGELAGVMQQEEGPMPGVVRFAMDHIQLRSDQHDDAIPPPPPPSSPSLPPRHAPTPPSTPETAPKHFASRMNAQPAVAPASPALAPATHTYASHVAVPRSPAGPSSHRQQHQQHSHSQSRVRPQEMHYTPPPPPPAPSSPPAPAKAPASIPRNQPVFVPTPQMLEQDLDDFPEPDQDQQDEQDVDESKLPHVPISIVGSVPPKKATSSFVIPLEHAREIVAKSSGKPVEMCAFGGLPLLQIQDGSVQARLLVTFAKACLAKQMKQLRDETNDTSARSPEKAQPGSHGAQQPKAQTSPQSSSVHNSENRSSVANAGSTYVPSNASSYAGNSYGPGKAKFASTFTSSTKGQESVLNSRLVAENDALEMQRATALATTVASAEARVSPTPAATPALPQRASETERSSSGGGVLTMSQLRISDKLTPASVDADLRKDLNTPPTTNGDALPKRVTEMISLGALLVDEESKEEKQEPRGEVPAVSRPQDDDALAQKQLQMKLELAGVAQPIQEEPKEEEPKETKQPRMSEAAAPTCSPELNAAEVRRKLSTPAYANHPVIQELCADSRDLELVMVGRDVDMILCKKEVVEEIQDILDSLEMELQFERHSHVGIGRGSNVDEPPVRCCSRCGKSGDMADLALDSERRELYCQNCWDVFFYHKNAAAPSVPFVAPPEFDTPTDFDPYEYSLHDSAVNVADDFHPWRHLHFDDSSSERDSDMTLASSITSHADEVWL